MPVLAMTMLSYPLVDTLRVFTLRVRQGRSPFSPDRNHLHHRMLRLGLSHLQAALCIHGYTALMVGLGFLLPEMPPTLAFGILLTVAFLLPVAILVAERAVIHWRAARQRDFRTS